PPLEEDPNLVAAAISPDGTTVATASNRPVVRLWNIISSSQRTVRELLQAWPTRLTHFRPDGRELLTSENDTLRRWDVATGAPLGRPMKHDGMVWAAMYSADGKWIVSGTRASTRSGSAVVYLWNAADGTLLFESAMVGGTAPEVFISPDSQTYAARSMQGAVQLRRTATGQLIPIRM